MRTRTHLPKIKITERPTGFWLWDETRGMNLAVKEKTKEDAYLSALSYYQSRLLEVEKEYGELSTKVNKFLSEFEED